MYGSEKFTMPLLCPFPVYVPRPSVLALDKPVPPRSEFDDFAFRHELPQTSSTENSSETRAELLVSSEMRDFSSCFSSYGTLLPTMTGLPMQPNVTMPLPLHSMGMKDTATTDFPQFGSVETHADCEGTLQEEDRKHEREHRKRSKNWTRPETLKLIQARTSFDAKFRRAGKKIELWDQISDVLQREAFSRDAQQCKDKWEKLMASYKEVRDGNRERDDFVFYDEVHALISGKSKKREREGDDTIKGACDVGHLDDLEVDLSGEFGLQVNESPHFYSANASTVADTHPLHASEDDTHVTKNGLRYMSVTDLRAVQDLMDLYLAKQRQFFAALLDEVERREQLKEKIRQEREDRWRAEEREQRRVLTNAMIILTQRLLGEPSNNASVSTGGVVNSLENFSDEQAGLKRRSKNWKRSEVLQLIKLRTEMDSKFSMPTRRVALWEELAEMLGAHSIHRDGKQCREKWDKLMAEFKDVTDGRIDQGESPFFMELKAFMEEGHCNP
eukprot:c15658_g1_i1 orf=583-2085(+)